MKGIIALHGYKQKRAYNLRVVKPKRIINGKRLCYLCGKNPISKGVQMYCGSYKRKTGCSYIKYREMQNECLARWRAKNPDDWKRTEKWRKKTGWYKKPEVAKKRKELSQKRYLRSKLVAPLIER